MGWSFVFPSNIGTQRSVTLPLTKQTFCIFQPAFAKNVRLLQIKNSWIPTVSVLKLLFCILWARHPKSFWDTLSQNYIKCFRHYSRWVFVSLNWDFFPVLTQSSGRARADAVVSGKYSCHQSICGFYWLSLCSFVRPWPWPRVQSVTASLCQHLLCYGAFQTNFLLRPRDWNLLV